VAPIKLIAAPRQLKYSGKRAFAAFLLLTAFTPGRAQNATYDPATGDDFFSMWFGMVSKAQAGQPHWMTPLVTVTPRLEQEDRYDQSIEFPIWQRLAMSVGLGCQVAVTSKPAYNNNFLLTVRFPF
jgi:hypothetical protein